jgi:hypothetical protein
VKTKVNNTNGKDKDSHPKLVDGALKLEVLHVDSPDKVWVRLAHYKDMWTEFHHDLQEAWETRRWNWMPCWSQDRRPSVEWGPGIEGM